MMVCLLLIIRMRHCGLTGTMRQHITHRWSHWRTRAHACTAFSHHFSISATIRLDNLRLPRSLSSQSNCTALAHTRTISYHRWSSPTHLSFTRKAIVSLFQMGQRAFTIERPSNVHTHAHISHNQTIVSLFFRLRVSSHWREINNQFSLQTPHITRIPLNSSTHTHTKRKKK